MTSPPNHSACKEQMMDNPEIVVRSADHIGFSVSSLDEAVWFWTEAVGLELIRHIDDADRT